jgi:acetyltransferase-like isoleucine patch superfamily enzyme
VSGWLAKLRKVAADPWAYLWVIESTVARVRGEIYRHAFRLWCGDRVSIGPRFVAECSLRILGPGRVRIGANCVIRRSNLQDVCILTLTPEASVEIGDDSMFGGLRLRCADRVSIGRSFLAARATVTDTDHGIAGDGPTAGRGITIGDDCWLGVDSTSLGGVRLGNNVVVSGGTVVVRDVPDDSLAMGNPARPVKLFAGG